MKNAGSNEIKQFREQFKYAPDLMEIFSDPEVVVLFFGMNPRNTEFSGILKSLFGKLKRKVFVLTSMSKDQIPKKIRQDVCILQYPQTNRDLALDFLVRLPRRQIGQKVDDHYQVFSNFQRYEYLIAQRDLERKALSIKYCTENFTNVFGTDDYLKSVSNTHAKKLQDEQKEITGSQSTSLEDFENSVLNGMIARRDNLYSLIREGKVKRIDVLFKKHPDKISEQDKQRIKDAIKLCKKGKVILKIKWIILDGIEVLRDSWPFDDPSMALIIGNADADFTVALCHASQANDKSKVRFQWVHKDTIFSRNRLGWFTRAWDLAQDLKL
jgi:hypothetical protein